MFVILKRELGRGAGGAVATWRADCTCGKGHRRLHLLSVLPGSRAALVLAEAGSPGSMVPGPFPEGTVASAASCRRDSAAGTEARGRRGWSWGRRLRAVEL